MTSKASSGIVLAVERTKHAAIVELENRLLEAAVRTPRSLGGEEDPRRSDLANGSAPESVVEIQDEALALQTRERSEEREVRIGYAGQRQLREPHRSQVQEPYVAPVLAPDLAREPCCVNHVHRANLSRLIGELAVHPVDCVDLAWTDRCVHAAQTRVDRRDKAVNQDWCAGSLADGLHPPSSSRERLHDQRLDAIAGGEVQVAFVQGSGEVRAVAGDRDHLRIEAPQLASTVEQLALDLAERRAMDVDPKPVQKSPQTQVRGQGLDGEGREKTESDVDEVPGVLGRHRLEDREARSSPR